MDWQAGERVDVGVVGVDPGAAHAVALLVDDSRDAAPGGGEVPGRTQAGRPRTHHAHSRLLHGRAGARRDLLETNLRLNKSG